MNLKIEKWQYRSVTLLLFLDGKSCIEIKERFNFVYGESSPSMASVKIGLMSCTHMAAL